ncbi:MAG: tol-pal system protein YbgF [Deltaproteobacteria bacterium]|nr:tol-pal system protein YbgF [Deltaproteobacteria bacterium]
MRKYLFLALVLPFFLGACVSSGLNPEEQALLRRLQSLEQQQASLNEQSGNSLQKMTADTQIRLDNLEREVRLLSQALEDSLTRPEEISTPGSDLGPQVAALESRLSALEKGVGPSPAFPPAPASPETAAAAEEKPAVIPGAREKAFYDDAYSAFKRGNLSEARDKFQKFIGAFPESSYKVNALFWLGECDYKAREFAEAILKYDEIISRYPGHPKAASAMLKQGFAFLEMNDPTDARIIFEKVIETYPNSEQAEIARRKLKSGL